MNRYLTYENSNYPSQESELLVKSFSQTMHDSIINLHHKRREKKSLIMTFRSSLMWPIWHTWRVQKNKQMRYKVIGNLFIVASFTAIQMINFCCHILGTATGTWQSGQWSCALLIQSKYCSIAKYCLTSRKSYDWLILAIWDFWSWVTTKNKKMANEFWHNQVFLKDTE